MFANTPKPPYYAVIFTTIRNAQTNTDPTYIALDKRIVEIAESYDDFLGLESISQGEKGITVSYWKNAQAIQKFKQDSEHAVAQTLGRERFYEAFSVRVAKVERAYNFGVET